MKKYDLVIQGGTIVSSDGQVKSDLAVQDGKISACGFNLEGKETIDARDLLVLPGGIDPHVHLQMRTATTITSDDWASGSRAALFGGTTTVIDFVEAGVDETLFHALDARKREANGSTWVDYALHMTISSTLPEILAQIPEMVSQGVSSFKCYTTYDSLRLNYDQIEVVMQRIAQAGGVLMVHAEDDQIIKNDIGKLVSAGNLSPQSFYLSRPPEAEWEAVRKCIHLAQKTGAHVYIVHLSTAEGIEMVANARREGIKVTAESCPQYLVLNNKMMKEGDAITAAGLICSPALRDSAQNEKIWNDIELDMVQTIGSDQCSFNLHPQKAMGLQDFRKVPGGLPGIELRYALIHTFGVRKNHLSIEKWVDLCSTNPAKVFGLFPRKGSLNVGSDADIVLFDPDKVVPIDLNVLHENVDYSPYAGVTLTGYPVSVIKSGKVMVQGNQFTTAAPNGLFLACDLPEF